MEKQKVAMSVEEEENLPKELKQIIETGHKEFTNFLKVLKKHKELIKNIESSGKAVAEEFNLDPKNPITKNAINSLMLLSIFHFLEFIKKNNIDIFDELNELK